MTIDQVSGAEVPSPEIAVSPAMIEAGALSLRISIANVWTAEAMAIAVFRVMRRVEMAEAGGVLPLYGLAQRLGSEE